MASLLTPPPPLILPYSPKNTPLIHLLYVARPGTQKKRCERNKETGKYNVELYYDVEDEKEILIRLLSFGPYIKVTSDDKYNFICKEIRERVKAQKKLLDKE